MAATTASTIQASEQRIEGLYAQCETILRDAMRQGNGAAALASIRTAVQIISEARGVQALKSAQQPTFGPNDQALTAELVAICGRRYTLLQQAAAQGVLLSDVLGVPDAVLEARYGGLGPHTVH